MIRNSEVVCKDVSASFMEHNACISHETATESSKSYTHLERGVLPHAECPHPHLCEQYLAAGVGDQLAMRGRHGQTQTRLLTPVLQFVRQ